ncbi:hypothetical protein JCM39068_36500 [Desulfocastanea catecholica]
MQEEIRLHKKETALYFKESEDWPQNKKGGKYEKEIFGSTGYWIFSGRYGRPGAGTNH